MKGVGRKIFYINCLYGVEMRGEEDTGSNGQKAERRLGWLWGQRERERECSAGCTGSCSGGCVLIIHDGTLEAIL